VIVPDVNVLVAALRRDSTHHAECRAWLERAGAGDDLVGFSGLVGSALVRVVTHPRIFKQPSPLDEALGFLDAIRGLPHCVAVHPGERHWEIFARLCRDADARGNLVPDAYFAALAIEHGAEWVTLDRDFSRFPGLRWRSPA
jgi:toxin-antitoxin system PIN domain toxin